MDSDLAMRSGVLNSERAIKVNTVKPDLLGLSALLTTTMDQMGLVIDALKERQLWIPFPY